ncbi:Mpv17/PMP22, partial [Dillenia turbinata]
MKTCEGSEEFETLYGVLKHAPEQNWIAYEEAKTNPVFAKMLISGSVNSVGDWIAQCYEGKPQLEFDCTRMFRSGLVGFLLRGSLSHYYYQFYEMMIALFHFKVGGWSLQKFCLTKLHSRRFGTASTLQFWGSCRESPANMLSEFKTTFWPLLSVSTLSQLYYQQLRNSHAGWKLCPFAHLITYGEIPVEQRLLWVDCVELIW